LPLLSTGTGKALPVAAACELDAEGVRAQGDRYRQLSREAIEVTRSPRSLIVRFSDEVDPALLTETIAIERGCCLFFAIDHDPAARVLSIGVDEDRLAPALDGIEAALRGR
jgi:hypothetical protein